MSANPPLTEPIMHPEALWDVAAIMVVSGWDRPTVERHIAQPAFPRPFRVGRAHSRWLAGEVSAYIQSTPALAPETEDHILYRYYNAEGVLLYVGISSSPITRLRRHRYASHWFRQATRIELERFPSREAALAAESMAIRAERPRHNRV